jgi:tripartite-type tricarboxylate transporter receptor subunit TctC
MRKNRMLSPYVVPGTLLATLIAGGAGMASAQTYPHKHIRIVTSEPGGGSDIIARLTAQGISGPLGQPVLIDNRGGGVLPAIYVAKATADGYTLLGSSGVFWIGPFLQKVNYDPVRDFAPITLSASAPNLLVVHPALPARSVEELIALAKANAGEFNYASAGTGGSGHLAAELFKTMARVNITLIPYNGAGPALNAMIGGEVQIMFTSTTSALQHVKSARLRALAVTSLQPTALAPGIPTMASSGLPGYEWATITGILAPAKTPDLIVRRLNQEIVRLLGRDDVKEKFFSMGIDPVGNAPQEYAQKIRSEMAKTGKLIKDAGIRAE